MGFRVQPLPIDIPADDPFRNDLLDRRESAEVLTHLLASIEGPCVLAVDAAWGSGKTTFLDMWSQHLRNKGFPVAGFNAWETDFSEDPFIALSTELTEGIESGLDDSLAKKVAETKAMAGKVIRHVVPATIRLATSGVLDIDQLLKAEERLSTYRKAKDSLGDFKAALGKMATALAEARDGLPLIVMIDELDRCRPSYAVELLEIAKHLFSVDRIVFVLAVNRAQLSHSAKALYGHNFDANEYLKRFIDLDFQLPFPDRGEFISVAFERTGITSYFERIRVNESMGNYDIVYDMLKLFFNVPKLNLRQISQSIHRIGLVMASLSHDERALALGTTTALILRTFDTRLCWEFSIGEKTDLEVIDGMFRYIGEDSFLGVYDRILFETVIIFGYLEISGVDVRGKQNLNSPLLNRYHEAVNAAVDDGGASDRYLQHARGVTKFVQDMSKGHLRGRVGFKDSVHRIELLSPGLISASPTEY